MQRSKTSAELKKLENILHNYIDTNLPAIEVALLHFDKDVHFIYPIEDGGMERDDKTRILMDIFEAVGIVESYEVDSWLGVNKGREIKIYELTTKGHYIFKNIFGKEPKLCNHVHYSRTH
jgi:hypothetical protein